MELSFEKRLLETSLQASAKSWMRSLTIVIEPEVKKTDEIRHSGLTR